MFCIRCGTQVVDKSHFCHHCGAGVSVSLAEGTPGDVVMREARPTAAVPARRIIPFYGRASWAVHPLATAIMLGAYVVAWFIVWVVVQTALFMLLTALIGGPSASTWYAWVGLAALVSVAWMIHRQYGRPVFLDVVAWFLVSFLVYAVLFSSSTPTLPGMAGSATLTVIVASLWYSARTAKNHDPQTR
jgi:hypothetical protein